MNKVKWFLETESTPDKEAVKTVEMTTKDLECYINLADREATQFEKTDPRFQKKFCCG